MYKRAEQLYALWHKQAYPTLKLMWDHEFEGHRRGRYDVAAAEAKLADHLADVWKVEIDRLKAEMATMVKRKHYNDAIKSLATCQQQIETLVVELRKHDPDSAIAHDAAIVMDLIEAMIVLNPDMQTEDWKADQKVKQDRRDAEYRVAEEKRRAVVQAAMWKDEPSYSDGWEMADKVAQSFSERYKWTKDNVGGAVGKDYKP